LVGSYYSEIFSYLELRVELCFGREDCATPDQIKKYLQKGNNLTVFLSYGHVDLDDYENPVRMFLDDTLFIPFET